MSAECNIHEGADLYSKPGGNFGCWACDLDKADATIDALRRELEQVQAQLARHRSLRQDSVYTAAMAVIRADRAEADRDAERARAEDLQRYLTIALDCVKDTEAREEEVRVDLEAAVSLLNVVKDYVKSEAWQEKLAALTAAPDKPGWHYAETAFPVTEAQE